MTMAEHGEDDDDFILEDAGFFGLSSSSSSSSSSHHFDAQKALNDLGLQPSPLKAQRSGYMDEDDESIPFDLDRELEMEEEQAYEEEEVPDDVQDEDEVLESNEILQRPLTSVNEDVRPPPARIEQHLSKTHNSIASTSSSEDRMRPPHFAIEDADPMLGINGVPKYIPSGIATATLLNGSTIRFEKKRRMKGWKPRPAHYGTSTTGLLSQPVHQIVDRVEAMRALKVVEDLERREKPVRVKKATQMWQERYRPQRFTELLGEERTHRDVLRWLKEWDACVFGKKAHLRKKWYKEGEEGSVYADKYSRPRERILLLGGPAGMGKTTLAHVAAKQCGYLVHELNASDDRSAKTVEDRVRDALESRSLKQDANLPTCLVLDEVDGATGGRGEEGGGFIKALIKLVEKGSGRTTGGKKGSKKGSRPLLRPIVCICNDPYSPNLRALRPYSKLIRLTRPSTPLLINRLKQICEAEDIRADSKGLNSLVDICQGDIRSCLNVLQLIQTEAGGLTAETFTKTQSNELDDKVACALGIKDGNSSIQQVWSNLFRTLTTREKAQKRGDNQETRNDQREGIKIIGSIMGNGEMDKILAGCFEHYPTLKLVDDGWWRFSKMHDWIYWYEFINKKSWEIGAQTEMWTYLPWSFMGWKHLFANTGNELPEYPRIDYQNHLKKSAFEEVTADLVSCLPASTRSQFNALSTITELGPSLVTLLSPDLKLINSQLVRMEERATLTSIVEILQHYNLNFVLDKNDQDQSYYRFEPPLEVFVQFEGKKSNFVGPAKFQLRQMIMSELNTARVKSRRIQMGKDVNESSRAQDAQGYKDAYARGLGGDGRHATAAGGAASAAGGAASAAGGAASAAGGPKTSIAVDFFGRPIIPKIVKQSEVVIINSQTLPDSILGRRKEKEGETERHRSTIKRSKLKVFYNYHEGYSNAVRKPVKMSSLLL
ncbi:hypothetical protein CBS101457_004700 [Exobasidium rhododendri]|nr:hypothetical protein CBS101457_004700 [Exobasidium rhododendri]